MPRFRLPWEGSQWVDWRRLAALTMAVGAVSSARPAVSYRALDLGAGPTAIAIIAGAFAAFALLFAVQVGNRIDRRGERGVFLVGCGVLMLSLAGTAFSRTFLILPLTHALLGLGQVSVGLSSQSVAALGGPPTERDLRFARNAAAVSIGTLAGPFIGGWVLAWARRAGFAEPTTPVFGVAFGFVVVALLLAWRAAPSVRFGEVTEASTRRPERVWSMVKIPGMREALVTSVAVISALDIMTAYLPVLGESRSLSPAFVGTLLSVRSAAGLASRVGLDYQTRHLGRGRVLAFNVVLAGLCLTGLILFESPAMLLVCAGGIGFGLGVSQPITASWVARRAPEGRVGAALAFRLSGNRFGQLVVPTLLGVLAGATGIAIVFVASSVALFGTTLLIRRIDFGDP